MQAELIKISKLKNNTGQIEGLPQNPRLIKNEKYKKLVQSIIDDPEMLNLRELIVFPTGDDYVVIGGNMRLRAMQEIGYKEAPCKVLPENTAVDKLKAYIIKDNVGFGEHDWSMLGNEWEQEQLSDWGLDITNDEEKSSIKESKNIIPYKRTHILLSFPPENILEVQDLINRLIEFDFIEYEQSSN